MNKYINIRPLDFRAKTTTKDKEGHYVMVNGINSSRKQNILKAHVPNSRHSKHMKKKLKGTIDKSISTVEDFNTSILVINETSKKISKKVEMNTSIQQELNDITRILNLTTVE